MLRQYERHLAWYKHLVKRKQVQTNNANQTAGNADDKNVADDEGSDNVADDERMEMEGDNEQKPHSEGSSLSSSSSSISSSDEDGDEISDDVKMKRIRLSDSATMQHATSVDQDLDSCKQNTNTLDETCEGTSIDEIGTRKVKTKKYADPSKQIDQSDADSFDCNTNSLDEANEGGSLKESDKVEKRKFEIDQSTSCSLELTDSQTVPSTPSCLQVEGKEPAESIKLHPGTQALSHMIDKTKKKLKHNTNKEDPYKIYEYLQLSLEEAFFLSYGLGCLVVRSENKELMNLTDMWKEFCSRQPTFLRNYIAYHYYRSRGWVPKTGVKFGAEFILYKKGPPFYHASYSVIVRMADERSLVSTNDAKERWSRWAGLNRVTETVAKEVLFCYVIKPALLTEQDLMSPKCISSFTIKEIVMKRIVPSRERANPQLPPEIT
ncbi:tRNA-splicing endonuclease subunit Sen2-like isoform X2 [Anneissia japonica]|uniref:tRNA-splicing endonuclease subunit Sen2-like isoform X2 n=1 Tax=Anneissia japonica TaxID=1529436 RepID=UPI0014257B3C|nr:tRNA-splicing endonuclease subunit Sen2-like isoform X2 [Anneissia japonica]